MAIGVAHQYSKVYVEISNICNLQCSFCPEVIRSKKMIDLNLFEHVLQQIAPMTELVCFHLMGDPLVHPELAELVNICEKYQKKIFLVTNGTLLREKQASILLRPIFHQVNFSLHSFFDNFPHEDPTHYLNRIFHFTDMALKERPELYINFRLWNLSDIRGTGAKNKEILTRIQDRYNTQIKIDADVRIQKSHRIRGRLYLHFDTEFIWPALDLPILGEAGRCHALSSHFGILVDGTVVPCCLDKEGKIPLGNIRQNSIIEILNHPRSVSILEGFKKGKLVEDLCKRCQYIERFGR